MKELFKSLWKFREQVSAVKKDADNPFYKSKYADLNSILEVIKDPLKQSGIAISHNCKYTESGFIVVTTLVHIESGEHIESDFPVFGNKPQEIWSSMSYARRYNLLALLDIPTEDDDWQKANEAPRTKATTATKWFNFKDMKQCIADWTDTEILLSNYIKDNWYTLSGDMKTCLRTYCDSWELVEPVRK